MDCKRVFTGRKQISVDFLWDEHAKRKNLCTNSNKYGCSKRTIQRKLDPYQAKRDEGVPKKVIVLKKQLKVTFTHKRLISAYRSLNTNMAWLFTWYDNYELNIPNTKNMIDGHFSELKTSLEITMDKRKREKSNS